ncbi:MAG: hypothetical protein ACR2O4_06125 [Hyphomicrobiaceae bacterium]
MATDLAFPAETPLRLDSQAIAFVLVIQSAWTLTLAGVLIVNIRAAARGAT